MAAKSKSNKFTIVRLFDAPLQAVWNAWTDPEQVAQWWGPRGFTITTHSKDLRSGGSWIYTMHGPDGTDYPNATYYHEVREREALIYDHGAGTPGAAPLFHVTALFKESGGKTELELTMTVATPEAADQIQRAIKEKSGNSTWDRLAEYLEHKSKGKDIFVINRSFDVPVDRMFEMWSDPRHFTRWLPPEGMQMEILHGEIKTGAGIFSRMYGGDIQFFGRVNYREVTPHRIVYTQQFCDEKGQVSRHPFAPTWPETMLTTVDFTPEGPDRTRVTVSWEPYGTTTAEELECFIKERGGMTKGWTGSFDKLEALFEGAEASASTAR
ncbi:MAG: SRPBCC family protein [Acidobacteriota bacterium]